MKNLLERTKGSPLDIITNYTAPVGTIPLLSLHVQRIRYLKFVQNCWVDVQRFCEVNPGPFSLLHTLEINTDMGFIRSLNLPNPTIPPSIPLFSDAVNLKRFVSYSQGSPFLSQFVFPNLTTFKISIKSAEEGFRASELLNFLETSPVLREVYIEITGSISLDGVAQRIVTLPSVQTFSLATNDGIAGYGLAAHISCPSASRTLLEQGRRPEDMIVGQDPFIFPTIAPWNAIVHQYTRSPVEMVSLEINPPGDFFTTCTLTFRSLDMAVIRLCLEISGDTFDDNDFQMSLEEIALEVFSQASRTVQDHPLLPDIKRLHIKCGVHIPELVHLRSMADEVRRLFGSVGPLEELTLRDLDLRLYLTPFLSLPGFEDMEQPIIFPSIKALNILHPLMFGGGEKYMVAVVELAKSQHALGVPFERVTVRARKLPAGMAEMLGSWVSIADCCEESYRGP